MNHNHTGSDLSYRITSTKHPQHLQTQLCFHSPFQKFFQPCVWTLIKLSRLVCVLESPGLRELTPSLSRAALQQHRTAPAQTYTCRTGFPGRAPPTNFTQVSISCSENTSMTLIFNYVFNLLKHYYLVIFAIWMGNSVSNKNDGILHPNKIRKVIDQAGSIARKKLNHQASSNSLGKHTF